MNWKAFLVFRPLNLLMLCISQFLAFYFLNPSPVLQSLSDPQFKAFIGLVFASMLLASAGYLINDLFDQTPDSINKPEKSYIRYWNKAQVNMVYLTFNLAALLIGYLIDWNIFQVFFTTALLLYLYSVRLQKWPLVGNLTVAFLSALSLLIIKFIAFQTPSTLILFYAGFAFLLSALREMVKDLEDIVGDSAAQYRTAAIVWGTKTNKLILSALTLVSLALYFILAQYSLLEYVSMGKSSWFMWYSAFFVGIPFLALLFLIYKAESKAEFHSLANLCKYIMYTGMMGMLFF